jgi:hypothetical protein
MMALAQLPAGQMQPPDTIFVPAPVIISPRRTPKKGPPNTTEFPPAPILAPSKPDWIAALDQNGPGAHPNVWFPQKIAHERSNHPTSQAQGTPPRKSLMQPQPLAAGHPFFNSLHEWGEKGVPVDCGPDWEWDVIEQAVRRGPHQSALDPASIALVHEDIQYQVDAGFSRVVSWTDLQKLRPSNLKISPLAVVPQKDRRGRLILDLSFPVYPERTKLN